MIVEAYLGLGKTGRAMGIREIATRLGVSKDTVHRTLQQGGIPLRGHGKAQRRCKTCGAVQSITEFHKRSQRRCNECRRPGFHRWF